MKSVSSPQVVLITGASKGIGFAMAQGLQRDGYHVIGVSRSQPQQPYAFTFIQADVTSKEDRNRLVTYLKEEKLQLDVLVQNAGIGYGGAIEELPEDAFLSTLQVNLLAIDQLNRLFLPLLQAQKGYVIHIGSVAGDLAIPFQTYYSASKAALERYSEGLRNEVRPFGVRVVTVKPGDTKSAFGSNRQKTIHPTSIYKERLARSLKRMETDEVQGMPTESVYRIVKKLIKKKNPPVSVTVGWSYQVLQILNKVLPKRWVQWLLYQLYAK
jgi:short-subunit dehydrogenase